MKKLILFLSVVLLFAMNVQAEEWEKIGDVSLNVTQNAYSENWAGEERSSITWVWNLNMMLQKQLADKIHNKNTIKFAFGQSHYQQLNSMNEKYWQKPVKSTDLIDLESMFRFTFGGYVDPFASLRLESQFLDNSVSDDIRMFNQIHLTEAFGIAKIFIKEEKTELSARLGAAFKQLQDSKADGMIDANDGGIQFVADYYTPLANDMITFTSKFELYKAMYYSEEDNVDNDYWKSPDISWENIFSAKLFKVINLNLYFQLLYDEEIRFEDEAKLRIKETLGLGISYNLF
ncbi:MAG: DUF3078 domain-containing protein [Candidatus Cloacimonetes bacterium]|nr:DUF3078 domain-containing protein [Candidatus Cloacimonadota bacterium]